MYNKTISLVHRSSPVLHYKFFFDTQITVAAFQTNLLQCAIGAFTTLDKVIKALTFWGLWKDMSRLHAQLLILQLRRRVSEAEAAERGYYYYYCDAASK